MFNIYEQTAHPDLKFRPFSPRELRLTAKSQDLFEELRRHDVLLHHPFDSYDAVVSFIEAAAQDPRVLSIKQTLYRTNEHSLIVPALISAAEKKEVTAVVELKARFDEDTNIRWARDLEDAGVQVFHGLVGLKTHCKLSLLVRRDSGWRDPPLRSPGDRQLQREYGADLHRSEPAHRRSGNHRCGARRFQFSHRLRRASPTTSRLLVAPLDLAERCLGLIEREAEHARHGRPARIIAKMNALLDKNIIMALYRASQAGVEIDLIVRGMCALRPGVRGVSDRIRVRSIVGRFLEHSRIFYFANGGQEEVYLAAPTGCRAISTNAWKSCSR